jgi:hypothetical protein
MQQPTSESGNENNHANYKHALGDKPQHIASWDAYNVDGPPK